MTRTAVIAGQGALAPAVIAALDAPLVYALDGFAHPLQHGLHAPPPGVQGLSGGSPRCASTLLGSS